MLFKHKLFLKCVTSTLILPTFMTASFFDPPKADDYFCITIRDNQRFDSDGGFRHYDGPAQSDGLTTVLKQWCRENNKILVNKSVV